VTTDPPQRSWRAACPQCGAPVEFASAASAFAVCSYCRSSVVREGEALRRIGQSAELFDDHSPLQLGAAGRYQGSAFTLVGRLQYRSSEGTWNEWHALFDGAGAAKPGWLSEDNGRYVMAFDAPLSDAAPAAETLRPGATLLLEAQRWTVASVTVAKLIAAQGELPHAPNLSRAFVVADLRNSAGEVATLDYSDAARPGWSVGRGVELDELSLTGLAQASEKSVQGRSLECPSCGTALTVQLATTKSIACHQCHAVVDVSGGIGADLQHYAQDNGQEPQIPLGSSGTLSLGGKPRAWQVVGYVERCEVAESGDEDDDQSEQTFWREYLLYHRAEGFAFLVDAEDGWSWAVPITGVPERAGDAVKYRGATYRKLYDYTGKVTYVLGEFYWRLEREQRTYNTDYRGSGAFASRHLNRERTGVGDAQEIVWSAGQTIGSDAILKAFKLAPDQAQALRRDAAPTSGNAASLLAKLFFWGFVAVVVLTLFQCDSPDDCAAVRSSYGEASNEYRNCLANQRSSSRTSGGSWGGYSSGGGHK
jgi:Domain of unknown function (DUF4178)